MTTTGVSTDSKNQIAIIYAQGEIRGEGDVNTIEGSCVVLLEVQEETKMLKLLYFVLTALRKCSYIRFNLRAE
jgi:protease-4